MTPDERGTSANVLLPSSCTRGFAASTSSTYLLVWQDTRQRWHPLWKWPRNSSSKSTKGRTGANTMFIQEPLLTACCRRYWFLYSPEKNAFWEQQYFPKLDCSCPVLSDQVSHIVRAEVCKSIQVRFVLFIWSDISELSGRESSSGTKWSCTTTVTSHPQVGIHSLSFRLRQQFSY